MTTKENTQKPHPFLQILAERHGTSTDKQQLVCCNWKENSKRSNAITAKRSINKAFDTTIENCLGGSVPDMNQEKLLVQSVSMSSSVVFQLHEFLSQRKQSCQR